MDELAKNDYIDLKRHAESIGMTPEEYALSLHEKNQALKSVLLNKGSEFKYFVTEFHSVLDGLTQYKDSNAIKGTYEHYELIKCVNNLLLMTSRDPNLLAQLYHHFPKGIDGKIKEFNNLTT
ncbi:hypothetical protein [Alkalibacterium sp. 20]|uniref:hypothetical protein n=1 Tax=Alkalibacterium sp. 20 TaxID=1798803 RepID=UPI0009003056|nr:hypothetical protein [Alkalibacterium sp. 20]OJF92166.1 hypothetical protein AX762_02890 [Alkalibacterium sp. 20]